MIIMKSAIMDKIRDAIDTGGGQVCDINGVLRELDKAGYVVVPKELFEHIAILSDGTVLSQIHYSTLMNIGRVELDDGAVVTLSQGRLCT